MPGSRRLEHTILLSFALLAVGVAVGVAACGRASQQRGEREHVVWRSDFSRGNFTDWSWWGQGQSSIWGHVGVVRPGDVGVPPLVGRYVARFQTTRSDLDHRRTNAKIYKAFSVDGPNGQRSPDDVSGTYRAWFYLPKGFRVPGGTAINMFQFKEQYDGHSDPLWWVQLSTASWATPRPATWRSAKPTRADAPVMFINHWANQWTRHEVYMAAPLGRWFEVRADVHQGKDIVFYVDGRRLDTASAREYPTSPFHANSQAWTFGVGEYGDALAGPLYVGGAIVTTPPLA